MDVPATGGRENVTTYLAPAGVRVREVWQARVSSPSGGRGIRCG